VSALPKADKLKCLLADGLARREPLDDAQPGAFEALHDEARFLDVGEGLAQQVISFQENEKGVEDALQQPHGQKGAPDVL
jgi:hypothetical protein